MLAQFTEKLGLEQGDLMGPELEAECQAAGKQLEAEPDNEALLVTLIKSQDREQKAEQSYEDNMDVQGFGSTFAGGFFKT